MLWGRQHKAGSWSWRGSRRPRGTSCPSSTTCWRTERCSWRTDASWCRLSATTSCCRSEQHSLTWCTAAECTHSYLLHGAVSAWIFTPEQWSFSLLLHAVPVFPLPINTFSRSVEWRVGVLYLDVLQEHTKEELDVWKIVRVSEDFRVIALGLPVPKYKGNPLDPPLRSRFQARDIYHLPFKVSPGIHRLLNTNRIKHGGGGGFGRRRQCDLLLSHPHHTL